MANKKAKKAPMQSAIDIADQLEVVRADMAAKKKIERDLTAKLLTALHEEGVNYAGNYKLVKAQVWAVGVEELALPFALERGLVKIDTSKVKKVFQLDMNLNRENNPEKYGFEIVTQEKIMPVTGYGSSEE